MSFKNQKFGTLNPSKMVFLSSMAVIDFEIKSGVLFEAGKGQKSRCPTANDEGDGGKKGRKEMGLFQSAFNTSQIETTFSNKHKKYTDF